MLVGYARTSTRDQEAGFEAQQDELRKLGCDEIFSEQVSSMGERAALDAALRYVRKGDVLVVTKLDRLARSMAHFVKIKEALDAKGCGIKIVNMNIDNTTSTGKLMVSLLVSVAEFEREMMLERQIVGIAKAKGDGKYKGRAPTARQKTDEVVRLNAEGKSAADIQAALGISRASVFRILKDARVAV